MSKKYLYHRVPSDMRGDTLYPLLVLKDKYPDIYQEYTKKYEGREFVMDQEIPKLNCRWNDALHLAAIDPREVQKALHETGVEKNWKSVFFKIDPEVLDPELTKVYLYKDRDNDGRWTKNDWEDFDVNRMDVYSQMNPDTIDYYEKCVKDGRRCLLFVGLAHILYKGEIDISNCEIVEVY